MKTITKKLDEVEFLSFFRHDEEKKEYLFRKINFESLSKLNQVNVPFPFVVCKSEKMSKEKELIMKKILENRDLLIRISGKTCFFQDFEKFGELAKYQGKDSSFGILPRDLLIATEFFGRDGVEVEFDIEEDEKIDVNYIENMRFRKL